MRAAWPEDELEREIEEWADSKTEIQVSAGVRRRIVGALSASLVPIKPLPYTKTLALIFLLVFTACAAGLIAMGDKAGFHLMTRPQMVSMAAILEIGGAIFSLALACRMIPGARRGFPLHVALALWTIVVIGGVAVQFPWRNSIRFVSEGWPCAATEFVIAVPSSVLFWSLARRGACFQDAGFGATVAGLASVLALLVLQFRCMFQTVPHLLAWHGLTAAALIGSGALIGRFQRRQASRAG